MSQPTSPKIVQKLALRTAALLFVGAGIFFGIRYLSDMGSDWDPGTAKTAGWIAAIESTGDGSRAVVFDESGTRIEAPNYTPGKEDKEAVWRPDGNRIFFISDREDNNFHIFRWNLSNKEVARRTVDRRSYGGIQYDLTAEDKENSPALLISRGLVFTFDPKTAATTRMIPRQKPGQPVMEDASHGGLGAMYSNYGKSFREVKWANQGNTIVGILRSEAGELLIVQPLETQKNGDLVPPQPVLGAEHIDFDVDSTGKIVAFTATRVKPLGEMVEAETGVPAIEKSPPAKFRHVVGLIDLTEGKLLQIDASNDDAVAFGGIVFSPDGSKVVYTGGKHTPSEGMIPDALYVNLSNGGAVRQPIVKGEAYHPAFDPTGQKLLFLMRTPKGQQIGTIEISNPAGTARFLGSATASYSSASFSPQQ